MVEARLDERGEAPVRSEQDDDRHAEILGFNHSTARTRAVAIQRRSKTYTWGTPSGAHHRGPRAPTFRAGEPHREDGHGQPRSELTCHNAHRACEGAGCLPPERRCPWSALCTGAIVQ